jgi:Flp pilus assembly protein TadG
VHLNWFHRPGRRGAIAVLCALLLVPIIAMLAFAIDTGYMCLTKTELQNAADAAALAGANALQPYFVQYNLPGQAYQTQIVTNALAAARIAAMKYASANMAGKVAITLRESDIEFGFLDNQAGYTSPAPGFPNTVSVTARRDTSANGQLQLFFGGVIGTSRVSLQATARSTMYTGDISGLQTNGQLNAHVLPVALDMNIWQTFYQTGQSPDGLRHPGPNNAWQIQVFPVPKAASGNFSLLAVGAPTNDTPTFRLWIDSGMNPWDIQYVIDQNLVPVSPSLPKQWSGGPGMTDTLVRNFGDALNRPNLIPLFKPVSTNPYQAASDSGNGATSAIVGFACVMVSQVDGNGSNLVLSVQPKAFVDNGTSTFANVQPAGGTGPTYFGTSGTTFVPPKLSN